MLTPPPPSTLFPYTTLFRSIQPENRFAGSTRGLMNADVLLDWIGQIRAERRVLRLIINKLLLRRKRKLRKIDTASEPFGDRKSTRLNSSHSSISYAVFCLKK